MSSETAYAWIANADPLTDEPALPGELWREASEERLTGPVEQVHAIADGEVDLVREESWGLSAGAQVRFLHARLLSGPIEEDAYVRDLPPEALAPAGRRLASTSFIRQARE